MKGYNGVALLSRRPLGRNRRRLWCGRDDARHVAAVVDPSGRHPVEVHALYVPAGGDIADPVRNPRFRHKLEFLDEFAAWSRRQAQRDTPRLVAGDFNVAPLETDVWSHQRLKNVVTHTAAEVSRLDRVLAAGRWTDAVRRFVPASEKLYTWWSYRTPDWQNADKGRRLDHVWVSRDLAPALAGARVLRHARGWTPPSDHVPVVVTLDP